MPSCVNRLTHPGGCEIGRRPIDLHLKALKMLNVEVKEISHGFIDCTTNEIIGTDIYLDFPSVGATENIMLAAVVSKGDTYIKNAAKEPEIVDLQNFLLKMGAKVYGAGTNIIKITGVTQNALNKNIEHSIIPDRIVAGTYLIAAAITKGDVVVKNLVPEHLGSIISNLKDTGCTVNISAENDEIHILGPEKLKAINMIRTMPYPGFPTDMQAQFTTLFSIAEGTGIIVENIFENRYMHIDELLRMGANIIVEGKTAIIKGVSKLTGANVLAKDLRGGAALILAGLVADGNTIISGITHVKRGYEDIDIKLKNIGAIIDTIT